MYRTTRLKITDLNPHLKCVLCGGYYVDATTIIECLHSFCRTCILRYLETSKFCPICDVMIHKTRPVTNIRADKTLQDLVYKLVPGLYKNEMKRRREFYDKNPNEGKKSRLSGEALGFEANDRVVYTDDERISISLELSTSGLERTPDSTDTNGKTNVRYLQCPAAVTVSHIKKFVRMKYDLSHVYKIDIFHSDEALNDDLTLLDIAYIYTWRRRGPLKLYYSVYENGVKRIRLECTEKELSDGSQPVVREKQTGPEVVSGPCVENSVPQNSEKKSNDKMETGKEAEEKRDRDNSEENSGKIVNGNEKNPASQENPQNGPLNGKKSDNENKAEKNDLYSSDSPSVKQESTDEQNGSTKGKERSALNIHQTVDSKERGQSDTAREDNRNTSHTETAEKSETVEEKVADTSENVKDKTTNKNENTKDKTAIKTENSKEKSVVSVNGADKPVNGRGTPVNLSTSEKIDSNIAKDKFSNGLVFNRPANTKDKTNGKAYLPSSGRKVKHAKRSLDDTVAKCKARELALQASGNTQRINNGGTG